jgi:hypothetical protein
MSVKEIQAKVGNNHYKKKQETLNFHNSLSLYI